MRTDSTNSAAISALLSRRPIAAAGLLREVRPSAPILPTRRTIRRHREPSLRLRAKTRTSHGSLLTAPARTLLHRGAPGRRDSPEVADEQHYHRGCRREPSSSSTSHSARSPTSRSRFATCQSCALVPATDRCRPRSRRGHRPVPARRVRVGRHTSWASEFPQKVEHMAFDPRRPGLDHVSFAARDRVVLDLWRERLERLGVEVARSRTPTTAPGSRSRTRTASLSSCSARRPPSPPGSVAQPVSSELSGGELSRGSVLSSGCGRAAGLNQPTPMGFIRPAPPTSSPSAGRSRTS